MVHHIRPTQKTSAFNFKLPSSTVILFNITTFDKARHPTTEQCR